MADPIFDNADDSSEASLPDGFIADLRDVSRFETDVPAAFDDMVLNRARAHLAGGSEAGGAWTRGAGAAVRIGARSSPRLRRWAAAAGIVLVAGIGAAALLQPWNRTGGGDSDARDGGGLGAPRVASAPGDINRDARVDILDAFGLARKVAAWAYEDANLSPLIGRKPPRTVDRSWDVNGDGRIDDADVQWIAARAVMLDRSIALHSRLRDAFVRHSREGGNPAKARGEVMDSRVRGNDGMGASLSRALTLAMFAAVACPQDGDALNADQPSGDPVAASPRFEAIDVFIDAGALPLAAWQVEFIAPPGDGGGGGGEVVIVGIEGGGHGAFPGAPYYDPEAMRHERAIIADFSLDDAAALPSGRVRIATIHVMIEDAPGNAPGEGDSAPSPRFEARVRAAADAQGAAIEGAAVTLQTRPIDDHSNDEDMHE
jgi:hypothetical protein